MNNVEQKIIAKCAQQAANLIQEHGERIIKDMHSRGDGMSTVKMTSKIVYSGTDATCKTNLIFGKSIKIEGQVEKVDDQPELGLVPEEDEGQAVNE